MSDNEEVIENKICEILPIIYKNIKHEVDHRIYN